ncbi:MAG: prenyltransferase [Thermoproteota archaeon]|nr:prenyltransferase [Thermoproteota archaeon]
MLSSWLRAIRIRFLLASVIAVSNGLAIAYWKYGIIDPLYAVFTYIGVIFLHASVDLLNDYWDHKRGIDSATTRTKFSGGTGVLPEKLLTPRAIYLAGLMFLILGAAIGIYFVVIRGITIALILGFAIVAIYFYSTSIVNAGLGEMFVAIKGMLIVVGTLYIQYPTVDPAALYVGSIVGILSATVLFVNSFPDHDADKSKGRRTLVIILNRETASDLFPIFIICTYAIIVIGIFLGFTRIYSLISFASIPFGIKSILLLRDGRESIEKMVPAMATTVSYSRITGFLLALSFIL